MQQRPLAAEIDNECIDLAVVAIVGETGSARRGALAHHRTRLARNVGEFPIPQSAKQRVLLRDEVNETAVEDENVEQPVVVEVVNAGAPAHVLRVGL